MVATAIGSTAVCDDDADHFQATAPDSGLSKPAGERPRVVTNRCFCNIAGG
jgi:hypothetical protein